VSRERVIPQGGIILEFCEAKLHTLHPKGGARDGAVFMAVRPWRIGMDAGFTGKADFGLAFVKSMEIL
jgi:hypothetical protein